MGEAQPAIHEMFVNVRGPGGHITVHGGGPKRDGSIAAGIIAGQWAVQYLSLIVALNDIGPGDGATCLVPGSHKSELRHPAQVAAGGTTTQAGVSATELQEIPDGHTGLQEIELLAGDAVLFNDSVLHGSVRFYPGGVRRGLNSSIRASAGIHRQMP